MIKLAELRQNNTMISFRSEVKGRGQEITTGLETANAVTYCVNHRNCMFSRLSELLTVTKCFYCQPVPYSDYSWRHGLEQICYCHFVLQWTVL